MRWRPGRKDRAQAEKFVRKCMTAGWPAVVVSCPFRRWGRRVADNACLSKECRDLITATSPATSRCAGPARRQSSRRAREAGKGRVAPGPVEFGTEERPEARVGAERAQQSKGRAPHACPRPAAADRRPERGDLVRREARAAPAATSHETGPIAERCSVRTAWPARWAKSRLTTWFAPLWTITS